MATSTTTRYTTEGAEFLFIQSDGPTGETAAEMRARFHAPHTTPVVGCLDCEAKARLDRLFR